MLTGPSGSGKSTLLNCLGLLDTPTTGTMRHHDRDITRLSPRGARAYRRDTLGYLFQNYALIDNATIADNLGAAVKPVRANRGSRPTPSQALEQVGLAGRGDDIVHRLSGGEQQRVALARLIVPTGIRWPAPHPVTRGATISQLKGNCIGPTRPR